MAGLYRVSQSLWGDAVAGWPQVLGAALIGALITALVAGFELLYLHSRVGERLRRLPFATLLLVRSIAAGSFIVFGLLIGNAFLIPGVDVRAYVGNAQFPIDIGFAFVVSTVFVFIMQVRQIIGSRVFMDFVFGRYYQPVSEQRLFMFLDLVDSTGLAQRLGDEGVHALITRFFFDIAGPVLEYGGETHRYVGDEVVITWPYAAGVDDGCCLRCVHAIDAEIDSRRADYAQRFGVVPEFRVGIHGGRLVAGECGEDRREIVFFGDTVNIAARVQSMCKALGRRVLITASTLADMHVPAEVLVHDAGAHRLRGRGDTTALCAIEFRREPRS